MGTTLISVRNRVFLRKVVALVLIIPLAQQLNAMTPSTLPSKRELKRTEIVKILTSEILLPTMIQHKILAYWSATYWSTATWKLEGACSTGAFHGPRENERYNSRIVTLTNAGLFCTNEHRLVHCDHSGKQREELITWKKHASTILNLTTSHPLPDKSSYVAAALRKTIRRSNSLYIWRIPHQSTTASDPTIIGLKTSLSKHAETIPSLVFSPTAKYLAAGGQITLTVLKRNKKTGTFSVLTELTPQHETCSVPVFATVNLSFPDKNLLVSLYNRIMQHWDLNSNICITTHDIRLPIFRTCIMSPIGYQLTILNSYPGVAFLHDIRNPTLIALTPKFPQKNLSGSHYEHDPTGSAYATNGLIVIPLPGNIIAMCDPYMDPAILQKLQIPICKGRSGISSLAISPDCTVIAAYDVSSGVSIFKQIENGLYF